MGDRVRGEEGTRGLADSLTLGVLVQGADVPGFVTDVPLDWLPDTESERLLKLLFAGFSMTVLESGVWKDLMLLVSELSNWEESLRLLAWGVFFAGPERVFLA